MNQYFKQMILTNERRTGFDWQLKKKKKHRLLKLSRTLYFVSKMHKNVYVHLNLLFNSDDFTKIKAAFSAEFLIGY